MAKKKNAAPWRNRIVRYGEAAPDSLLANEENWRIHPLAQQQGLTSVLEVVGVVQNILVNLRTSQEWPEGKRGVETLIDGHARVGLALSANEPSIPITYVDLTPNEEAIVLATLDPITAMAVTDKEMLSQVMQDVHSDDERLQQLIASIAEQNGIGTNLDTSDKDERLNITERFEIVIDCEDETTQVELLERFEGEGLKCRALVS